MPWQCSQTFASILGLYAKYVADHYGRVITVVFDGYESGLSTKDATHQRRSAGGVGLKVNFTPNMTFSSKKDDFLSNSINKQ